LYRHIHLVATNLVHIVPDGVRSYSNVTGPISSGATPADGHTADSVVTAGVTIINHDTDVETVMYRASLVDISGEGEV